MWLEGPTRMGSVSPTALPLRENPSPPTSKDTCLAKVRVTQGGETPLQGGTDAAGGSWDWLPPPVSNLTPQTDPREGDPCRTRSAH